MDFEQPRALYNIVFKEEERETQAKNFASHMKNIKKTEIRDRQRTCSTNYSE